MSGNSQTKAIRKMIRLGHSVLVAREHLKGKRSFESFESLESLHKWMTTLPDASRNLYHVDLSNAGTSTKNELSQVELTYISQFVSLLVFDVEWLSLDDQPDPLAEQRIEVLKRVVLETLQQVLPATTYGVEVEYLGRMPQGKPVYKNSYHLVIPGAVFEHNATGCMGDFVKQVLWPELEKHKEMLWIQPKDECIVDRAIYTRTRQIRMPGCSKFGGVGLQVATLEDLHRMRTSYYYAEQDRQTPVITTRMVAEMLPPPPPPVKRRRENATSSNTSNSISPKRVKHVASYALCAALTAWLKAKGDQTSTVKPDGNVYLVMNPNAGCVARVCVCDPTGQTTHMRNNGKITINENTRGAWFHCWSDKCQHKDVRIEVLELGASSSSSMVMVDEEEEEEKVYVPRPASSSSMVVMGEEEEGEKVYVPPPTATAVVVAEVPWTDNRQYLDTTERYLTEDTRLNLTHADGRAFASTWKNKMLLAGTPQNTGKTRWSNQLVVGRREHGTVVVVSPLIS
jgi:hypothetical protein